MTDVSEAAREVCAAYFPWGEKCTVKSNPPHATVTARQEAWDELLAKGIITKEPYNRFDVWLYRGTRQAEEIGRVKMAEVLSAMGISGSAAGQSSS